MRYHVAYREGKTKVNPSLLRHFDSLKEAKEFRQTAKEARLVTMICARCKKKISESGADRVVANSGMFHLLCFNTHCHESLPLYNRGIMKNWNPTDKRKGK